MMATTSVYCLTIAINQNPDYSCSELCNSVDDVFVLVLVVVKWWLHQYANEQARLWKTHVGDYIIMLVITSLD